MFSCVWQVGNSKQPLFYQASSTQVRKPLPTAAAKGSGSHPYKGHWLQRTTQIKKRVPSPIRVEVPPTPLQNFSPFSKGKKSPPCLCPTPVLPPPAPHTLAHDPSHGQTHTDSGLCSPLTSCLEPVARAWVTSQENTVQACVFPRF